MKTISQLKQLPDRVENPCFACGKDNAFGLKMTFYTDEQSVYSFVSLPNHLCGFKNIVHGGIISTLLDEIMSWSAIYLLDRLILTKSMTVHFVKPIFVNTDLTVQGYVLDHMNDREAKMTGKIYNKNDELCAYSEGQFALFTAESIKKLKIMDEASIENFNRTFGT